MAGFDYRTNITAVLNALQDYNTTTASPDLSGSMTARIPDENIVVGDPDVSMLRMDRMPAIFIRLDSGAEEFSEIGPTGPTKAHKFKTVTYSIFAMYARAGGSQQNDETSVMNMLRNIEAVFQAEYTLSGTALWCNPKSSVIANVPIDAEAATWVKTVMVELEAKYFFR
jgi:hypothetical protein